jgi:hypothetical protein
MDAATSFANLKESLKTPLAGMGIAFGCSLFGLSSSLVLGFLNVNQRQVANDFFGRVEEWLARRTVSFSAIDDAQGYHGQVFSMALLEKTIEMIYAFQGQLKSWDSGRVSLANIQIEMAEKMARLTESIVASQEAIKMLARNQIDLQNVAKGAESICQDVADKLSSINSAIASIEHASTINRNYVVENLGKDIRLISKTLSSSLMGKE